MPLTDDIKNYALDIGYTAVGITTADPFDAYAADLTARGEAYAFYRNSPRRPLDGAAPRSLMPTARSILILAYDYARLAFPAALCGVIGRIYQARAYSPPPQRIHGARRQLLEAYLIERGLTIGQNITVPFRMAAARAGITTYGNNTFAYARGGSSFLSLDAMVVDAELAPDAPSLAVRCRKGCTACQDACPTGAILGPLRLDPRRCITFQNCFARDGFAPGVTGTIPLEFRQAMGQRVHGCDACQEACPRNRPRLTAALPSDPFLERFAAGFRLTDLLAMDEAYFATTAQQLMYNYIRERKYFQRNAAIALGNRGDDAAIPALGTALGDPEGLVRGHAAWALGRLGGGAARRALEAARTGEADPMVRTEIDRALAGAA
ncbi:Epoxyqueuosine (oQ) reductase QueG [Desulfovibrio sp. DV]|uniref:epoxyqueuosine reductase n=1 Tax=Desulfovibrio sp. DV TaxID=1844708 RepID=UPI00094BB857|nr:HEAT repeat domain-containing protein [Desulfovibrio sp. DV]OLN24460.1 Epoxyqueuosine (oQ) reductase QueG [Desulfovibrio sp. DV]